MCEIIIAEDLAVNIKGRSGVSAGPDDLIAELQWCIRPQINAASATCLKVPSQVVRVFRVPDEKCLLGFRYTPRSKEKDINKRADKIFFIDNTADYGITEDDFKRLMRQGDTISDVILNVARTAKESGANVVLIQLPACHWGFGGVSWKGVDTQLKLGEPFLSSKVTLDDWGNHLSRNMRPDPAIDIPILLIRKNVAEKLAAKLFQSSRLDIELEFADKGDTRAFRDGRRQDLLTLSALMSQHSALLSRASSDGLASDGNLFTLCEPLLHQIKLRRWTMEADPTCKWLIDIGNEANFWMVIIIADTVKDCGISSRDINHLCDVQRRMISEYVYKYKWDHSLTAAVQSAHEPHDLLNSLRAVVDGHRSGNPVAEYISTGHVTFAQKWAILTFCEQHVPAKRSRRSDSIRNCLMDIRGDSAALVGLKAHAFFFP